MTYGSTWMSNNVTLIEDGVAPPARRERNRPSWALAVAGFVVGLGLGVTVVGPPPAETEQPSSLTTPTGEPPVATLGTAPVSPGLGDVIPGFLDALVVVSDRGGGALDRILWPNRSGLTVTSLTGGSGVLLDAQAQHVAMSTTVPGLDGVILSMGRPSAVEPVASGVTSYVWHDSTSGWLGYTVDSGSTTQLFTTKGEFASTHVVELAGAGATVVGWGDWGWALQDPAGEVVLLTSEGEFRDSEVGLALDTSSSGWVFMAEGGDLKLVSAGGGVRRIAPSAEVGPIRAARFSPDGQMVAISGSDGLVVLDVESGAVGELSGMDTDVIAWSSESRFLITGTGAGVVIFEIGADTVQAMLREHPVVQVGVVPLGS
jgi:hypothetical protein